MKGKRKMAQVGWFRVLGVTGIGSIFTLMLAAQGGSLEAIEQKLNAEFKPTTITADRSDVVSPGDRVVIQKPGLTMYAVASPMPPLYTYKNGKIGRGLTGLGKDMQISMKTPGGTAADYPHRPFAPGERCWVTQVQVQKDGVIFQLYSDVYEEVRYYADLKIAFPDKKEVPQADTVLQLIAEALTVAPPENHVEKSAAAIPVTPVIKPPQKAQEPKVSGRYNFDEGDAQLEFLSSERCNMIGPGANQSPGRYRVNGNVLTMDCTVTGRPSNLKIQGDNLVAENGHVWIRLENALLPDVPKIAIGQSKNEVIAALGKPMRVTKAGAKDVLYYKDIRVTLTNGKVSGVE